MIRGVLDDRNSAKIVRVLIKVNHKVSRTVEENKGQTWQVAAYESEETSRFRLSEQNDSCLEVKVTGKG